MSKFLFTVSDVFGVSGDLIPAPGVPPSVSGISVGLPIELRRPDGVLVQTRISSLPIIDPYDAQRRTQIGLRDVARDDLPIGTEIWLVDQTHTA